MTDSSQIRRQSIVHQVYGPPGTGKTRYLTEKVREVVARQGPDSLVIASFSVTAAREIASRGLGLPDRAVGTLHSHAFRGLGGDVVVALDPKVVVDWNAYAGPQWRITPDTRRGTPESATEGGSAGPYNGGAPTGDEFISSLDKSRSLFVDPADYPPDLAAFAKSWTEWKRANGAVDYTDMIELALERARDGEAAPGSPQVFVVDEGQDNTPLEVELILNWGKRAASLVVALDDDQAIMEWRGGDPRRMLTLGQGDEYDVDRHVLGKSYRIPRAVHRVAEHWVRRLSLRQPKRYDPRTTDREGKELAEAPTGAVFCVPESITNPGLAEKIEQDVEQGHSVMVIASCTYMLNSLITGLKNRGLPFHNPFRPGEFRWNPLGRGNGRGMTTVERVYRYLVMREDAENRLWTGRDIRAWLPLLRTDAGLVRGAKQLVESLPDGEVPFERVVELFADNEALAHATESDLEWFAASVLASKQKNTDYPLQVVRQRGPKALKEGPQIIVGTIHSIKGGAADIVYLAPDMSNAGMANLGTVSGKDQMIRLFYVAMTRAYEQLRLLAPMSARNYINRRSLIPAELEVPA